MTAPRVSVVINTWNGEAYLRDAIASVLAQSYQDYEILVYDDVSQDGTEAVARSIGDPRLRFVRAPAHVSLGRARDAALREARGTWIAWLDQDDLWLPHKLAAQMAIVESDPGPDLAVVYGRTLRFWEDGREKLSDPAFEFRRLPEGHIHEELLLAGCFIAMSSSLVLRSACLAVGGIPEGFDVACDFALFVRLTERHRARALQEPCCRYRQHGHSLSWSSGDRAFAEAAEIVRRFGTSLPVGARNHRARVWESLRSLNLVFAQKRFVAGIVHLLRRGSLSWAATRPVIHLARAVRRAVQGPRW